MEGQGPYLAMVEKTVPERIAAYLEEASENVTAAKDLACASGDTATCSALWIEIGRLDGMRNVLSEREGER